MYALRFAAVLVSYVTFSEKIGLSLQRQARNKYPVIQGQKDGQSESVRIYQLAFPDYCFPTCPKTRLGTFWLWHVWYLNIFVMRNVRFDFILQQAAEHA